MPAPPLDLELPPIIHKAPTYKGYPNSFPCLLNTALEYHSIQAEEWNPGSI